MQPTCRRRIPIPLEFVTVRLIVTVTWLVLMVKIRVPIIARNRSSVRMIRRRPFVISVTVVPFLLKPAVLTVALMVRREPSPISVGNLSVVLIMVNLWGILMLFMTSCRFTVLVLV